MALTKDAVFLNNGENLPLPTGYVPPTTAIVQTAPVALGPYTYEMTATSGVSTTGTLGLDALVTAFESWLAATFIPTTLGVDIVTKTVTAIATITRIAVGDTSDDIFLNDATRKFRITFTLALEVA